MSYEIPSQQPDMLLDHYERHFLRVIGEYACTDQVFMREEPESEPVRALKLYEPNDESIAITNSFIDVPAATATDSLALLALRAKVWGDGMSQKIAVDRILNVAESRGHSVEVSNEDIVSLLALAGRPDIAHEKLDTYRGNLGDSEKKLLLLIGKAYCKVAKSKEDIEAVPGIIEELEASHPKHVVTRGWWIFKKTQTYIDKTQPRLYKELQGYLNGATNRIEHPERFTYAPVETEKDPYPYATAYHEGGLSAAFGLHEYRNRALRDKSSQWSYRSIVGDLAQAGELAAAYELAQEGLVKVAQEDETGVVPAHTHYDIVRHIIDAYAHMHDLKRAHEITIDIPRDGGHDVQVSARRMAAREYIQGYADELQPGDTIPDHCLETVIEYVKQYVYDDGERNATFEWIMQVLAPYGQTDAIKRIAEQLPPLKSTPYWHGRRALFASHLTNKDYEACLEYLEYWPNVYLTVDALASVVQEKQRRKAIVTEA